MRDRLKGFTLVELLVVMGIIAILLAIFTPFLSGIRQRAKLTQCSSNLRQIGLAIRSYCTDTGRWPLGYADPASGLPASQHGEWAYFLSSYLGGERLTGWQPSKASRVTGCPSVRAPNRVFFVTYSAHPAIMVDPGWSDGADPTDRDSYPKAGLSVTPPVERPSDVVVMLDGLPWLATWDNTYHVNATFCAIHPEATHRANEGVRANAEQPIRTVDAYFTRPFLPSTAGGPGWIYWVHDDRVNTLRADFHVEPIPFRMPDGSPGLRVKHVTYKYIQ